MPDVEETVQSTAVVEDETTEAATAADESEVAKSETEETEASETQEESGEELPEGARREEDGTIVLEVEGSVFKGKTLMELNANVVKSVADSQRYIRELKAQSVQVPDTFKGRSPEKAKEEYVVPEPPSYEAIAQTISADLTKKYNVEAERLQWRDKEWEEYLSQQIYKADEEGKSREFVTVRVQREMAHAEAVKNEIYRQAQREYGDKSNVYANDTVLDDETQRVRKIVARHGVELSKEKYAEILEKVYSDKDNFINGALLSGSVTDAVWDYIHTLKTTKVKSAVQKQVEADIANGLKAKDKIKSGNGSPAKYQKTEKSYNGDWGKVLDAAKAEARALKS